MAEEASGQSRLETPATAWQRAAEPSTHPQAAAKLLAMAASAAGWIGQVDRAASLANRPCELTTEPAVRARVRGVLGYALSLTLQHGRTVALMSDLAPELAGTEDMAWAAAGMAAKAAYSSGEDALREQVLAMLHTLNGDRPAWQAAA